MRVSVDENRTVPSTNCYRVSLVSLLKEVDGIYKKGTK